MDDPEVYIVRVYRRNREGLAGLVEAVGSGQRRSFKDAYTLWQSLTDFSSLRRNSLLNEPEKPQ